MIVPEAPNEDNEFIPGEPIWIFQNDFSPDNTFIGITWKFEDEKWTVLKFENDIWRLIRVSPEFISKRTHQFNEELMRLRSKYLKDSKIKFVLPRLDGGLHTLKVAING